MLFLHVAYAYFSVILLAISSLYVACIIAWKLVVLIPGSLKKIFRQTEMKKDLSTRLKREIFPQRKMHIVSLTCYFGGWRIVLATHSDVPVGTRHSSLTDSRSMCIYSTDETKITGIETR